MSAPLERTPSLADVTRALRGFMNEDAPSILAVTGKWGSGKSYFWREFLKAHVKPTDKRLYSYVSLFGLGDLQQLKDAVFDNAVSFQPTIGPKTSVAALLTEQGRKDALRTIRVYGAKIGSVVERVPTLTDLAPFARSLAFLSVKNYVVCIDDLERRGKDLPLRDVLGLATFLREQRGCRVVIILNSDALEDDRAEFDRLREKVFDYEISFEPGPADCAAIAFPDTSEHYRRAREHAIKLGITNIRVLFRVQRLLDVLMAVVGDAPDAIRQQVVHSGVLLGWSYNTRDGSAPDYEYIKRSSYSRIVDKVLGKEATEQEKSWQAVLEAYDYQNTDDLDRAICSTLEHGYADTRLLEEILANREEAARRAQLETAFHDAWQIFHGGFGDDRERLFNALESSLIAAPELVSVTNASSTIGLIRTLGNEALADKLAKVWIEANARLNPKALDLADSPWGGDVKDAKLREAILAAFAQVRMPPRPLSEVADELGRKNGWSQEDMRTLERASTGDFYELFKSLSGSNTRPIIRAFIRIVEFGGGYEKIGARIRDALIRLGRESRLNADRLNSMGFDIGDSGANSPVAPEGTGGGGQPDAE